MRTVLLGIIVCSATVGSAAVGQELPREISALYEDLRTAIATGDLGAVAEHLTGSSVYDIFDPGSQGLLGDIVALQGTAKLTAVAAEPKLLRQVGDWALLRVAYRMEGTKVDGGGPWQDTWQCLDLLRRTAGGWQLFASRREDPERAGNLEGGEYDDWEQGVTARVPADWTSAVVAAQNGGALLAVPPDLGAFVLVDTSVLPVVLTPEELFTAATDAIRQLVPELQLQVLSEGPTTLGGLDAYRRSLQLQAGGALLRADGVMAAKGLTLYSFTAEAGDPATLEALAAQLDGIEQSIKITAPEAARVPEGLGRVEGRTFTNDKLGCSITAPEGWAIHVTKGLSDLELQVAMAEPGGESTFLLATADVSDSPGLTPQLAMQSEDALTQQALQDLRVYREGPRDLGGLDAYESVTEFSIEGHSRGRWRIYATDGNLLYVLVAEAVPSNRWQELEPTFQAIVDSFHVGP